MCWSFRILWNWSLVGSSFSLNFSKLSPIWGPLSMVQSVVINFSSKVYSKGLLKGSVVYSLILGYQFCTCLMRISSVPQLQVFTWSVYIVISDIPCMVDGLPLLYWRWDLGKSGQVWAMLGLQKSCASSGEIVRLHNCAVADITPQLWHDVTPQLRSSAKRKDGGRNMIITYDVTPQQRLNPSAKRWMAEPADHLWTQPKCMRSKVNLRSDSPLFHQMFVNIWGLFYLSNSYRNQWFPQCNLLGMY